MSLSKVTSTIITDSDPLPSFLFVLSSSFFYFRCKIVQLIHTGIKKVEF